MLVVPVYKKVSLHSCYESQDDAVLFCKEQNLSRYFETLYNTKELVNPPWLLNSNYNELQVNRNIYSKYFRGIKHRTVYDDLLYFTYQLVNKFNKKTGEHFINPVNTPFLFCIAILEMFLNSKDRDDFIKNGLDLYENSCRDRCLPLGIYTCPEYNTKVEDLVKEYNSESYDNKLGGDFSKYYDSTRIPNMQSIEVIKKKTQPVSSGWFFA